jgi:hypothetical protein
VFPLLLMLMQVQSAGAFHPDTTRRVAEEIYDLDDRDFQACDRLLGQRYDRIFERGFGQRIRDLKQKEARRLGPDPGFDVTDIGRRCMSDRRLFARRYAQFLSRFERGLTALERREP